MAIVNEEKFIRKVGLIIKKIKIYCEWLLQSKGVFIEMNNWVER